VTDLDNINAKMVRRYTAESGKKYQIRMLPARQGGPLLFKLTKTLFPAAASIWDALSTDADLDDIFGSSKFSEIAGVIVEQLADFDLNELIDKLLKGATIQEGEEFPRDINIDMDFMADYGELLEVLGFAIKENFWSTLKGKGISRLLAGATQKS
jgi:hypothetical protein